MSEAQEARKRRSEALKSNLEKRETENEKQINNAVESFIKVILKLIDAKTEKNDFSPLVVEVQFDSKYICKNIVSPINNDLFSIISEEAFLDRVKNQINNEDGFRMNYRKEIYYERDEAGNFEYVLNMDESEYEKVIESIAYKIVVEVT